MSHVTYTELRANLAGFMDEVCNTRAPLLVTRRNARSVVMVSEDDFEGLMETVHLLTRSRQRSTLARGNTAGQLWRSGRA